MFTCYNGYMAKQQHPRMIADKDKVKMSFSVDAESGEVRRQTFNPEDVTEGRPRVLKFRHITKIYLCFLSWYLILILDGNSKHVAHACRNIDLFGERKKYICDCSPSNQMS